MSAFSSIVISGAMLLTAFSATAQSYLVQNGDRLEVTVLEDPGLNRTVLVRPDGRISLPLAGTVQAAGNSPEQVQAAIRRNLSSQFVQPPTVTVSVVALGEASAATAEVEGMASIYVIGEVARPGPLQIELPMDALRALAVAGGPGVFAARQRIQIRRQDADGTENVFLFDYDAIERGAVPIDQIMLADGDVIVVPERRLFE